MKSLCEGKMEGGEKGREVIDEEIDRGLLKKGKTGRPLDCTIQRDSVTLSKLL